MPNRFHRRLPVPVGAVLLLLAIGLGTAPGCRSERSSGEEGTETTAAGKAEETALDAPPPAAEAPGVQSLSADSGSGTEGGPRTSFSEFSHDFGNVSQGTKLTHVFKVRNTGTEPLELIRAKGS